ncbi:hypothetical protein CEXT_221901 [Caerostris extrusa]|uniref:Transmembrane protein n=1 Tax=Caerostris extrusa TaxID=172846 RepID=A0AAV4XB92_CAEEX|nr:hypothetical protein CEXT_221901 [Caerostris extrusa]
MSFEGSLLLPILFLKFPVMFSINNRLRITKADNRRECRKKIDKSRSICILRCAEAALGGQLLKMERRVCWYGAFEGMLVLWYVGMYGMLVCMVSMVCWDVWVSGVMFGETILLGFAVS